MQRLLTFLLVPVFAATVVSAAEPFRIHVPKPEDFGIRPKTDANRVEFSSPPRRSIFQKIPYLNRMILSTVAIHRDPLPWDEWEETRARTAEAIAVNGTFLLTACEDGRIDYWDLSGRGAHHPKLVPPQKDKEGARSGRKERFDRYPEHARNGSVSRLLITPDHTAFWAVRLDRIVLYDIKDGREIRTITPGRSPDVTPGTTHCFTGIAALGNFAADGGIIAVREEDAHEGIAASIVFFETKTGRRFREIRWPALRELRSLHFSPDGRRMIAGAGPISFGINENIPLEAAFRSGAMLFDMASGQLLGEFDTDGRACEQIDFSPDGMKILTVARRNGETARDCASVVHVWNAATGEMLHRIIEPRFDVQGAAFSYDGARVQLTGQMLRGKSDPPFPPGWTEYIYSEGETFESAGPYLVVWNLGAAPGTVSGATPQRMLRGELGGAGHFIFNADTQRLVGRGIRFF